MMSKNLTFLDLFAGAGGLSEGFIGAGFEPIAHVESDKAACYTLRTRMAFHWLRSNNRENHYVDYLNSAINRTELYGHVPRQVINSVVNAKICRDSLSSIFKHIDLLLGNRRLDLIVGGPPCQAYSVIGRSRDKNQMQDDRRNFLYLYYAEFLKRYRPQYFVFENVTGLFSAKDQSGKLYFDKMRVLFKACGYETEFMTLSAENYGVLQRRKRIILVGKRGNSSGFYPEPSRWNPSVSVNELLYDLPALAAGEGTIGPCSTRTYNGTWQIRAGIRSDCFPITWHQARPNCEQDREIYQIAVNLWNQDHSRLNYNALPDRLKTHRHRISFLDRFKVVAWDLPFSHTVVAHIAKDGHYYIHPDISQNRSITPREAARLQTFPDDFFFEGCKTRPGRTPAFRQIGNAVPVLLARKIALKLKETWL